MTKQVKKFEIGIHGMKMTLENYSWWQVSLIVIVILTPFALVFFLP